MLGVSCGSLSVASAIPILLVARYTLLQVACSEGCAVSITGIGCATHSEGPMPALPLGTWCQKRYLQLVDNILLRRLSVVVQSGSSVLSTLQVP